MMNRTEETNKQNFIRWAQEVAMQEYSIVDYMIVENALEGSR